MKDQKCTTPDCPGEIRLGKRRCLSFDFYNTASTPDDFGVEVEPVVILAHLCNTCGKLVDVRIENRKLDADPAQMRAAIESEITELGSLSSEYGGCDNCNPILQGVIERLKRSLK